MESGVGQTSPEAKLTGWSRAALARLARLRGQGALARLAGAMGGADGSDGGKTTAHAKGPWVSQPTCFLGFCVLGPQVVPLGLFFAGRVPLLLFYWCMDPIGPKTGGGLIYGIQMSVSRGGTAAVL